MNAVEQGSRFVVRLCSCISSGDNSKVAAKLVSLLKELRGSSGASALQTQSPALYERIFSLVLSLQKAVDLAESATGVAAMQVSNELPFGVIKIVTRCIVRPRLPLAPSCRKLSQQPTPAISSFRLCCVTAGN